ncbi:ABC transporter permease [Ruminococcus sp. OA3]|uniref:ABC transporter permease n=1 Tax=Ruminococcus sp. OA3 TaxID=2914164 RepID=UPI001F054594|nr:ABC transporter permease [Ruminococcus sp. OA3]MCH1982705.1 ABC transporter permease [Ruminococcus sp. OA3]
MTVFKGFLKIIKSNLHIIIMYVVIFMTISVMTQKFLGEAQQEGFEASRLEVAVIDKDGGKVAGKFTEYLAQHHNVKEIPNDRDMIQEEMFNRNIDYVAVIPENFVEKCFVRQERLETISLPDSNKAFYADQQINTFLNDMRVMTDSGFSAEEAAEEILKISGEKAQVTMLDQDGHGGQTPSYAFMFQYMPYIMLAVLCYCMSYVLIAFRKKEVRSRMLCSAVSVRSQNLQMILGTTLFGIAFWGVCLLMTLILNGVDFLRDAHALLYILNSFLLMLVALSMAYLLGTCCKNDITVNAVVNVAALGMSFLCGVFVPLQIIGSQVRRVAQFLPVYWYEYIHQIISSHAVLDEAMKADILKSMGIQLAFAVAFLCIAVMLDKYKGQTVHS